MDQLIEFAGNHFLLVTSFFFVLTLLIMNLLQDGGGMALGSQQAVGLLNQSDAIAIDTRSAGDYQAGHIINAEHIEAAQMTPELDRLIALKEKPVLIYCASGVSSTALVRKLRRAGFQQAHSLRGGIKGWQTDNLPVTKD
jgi:rhodanese-related sulfurtransferase